MASVQIFLSTVSAEFASYRDALRRDLDRPNVTVKVQEDFIATGTETLDKLDEYIRQCHAVIHLVGDMTGALAQPPSVAALRQRYADLAERLPVLGLFLSPDALALSYTQWEAWLALYHAKVLIIAVPQDGAPRDERYRLEEAQRAVQQAHLARLAEVERYPEIRFANADRLAVDVLRSKLQDILALAGALAKPNNLPYTSLGSLFKGRETFLEALRTEFLREPARAVVVYGLGGVGKTRLAVEYAWRHAAEYRALLTAPADSPESLNRGIAALCKPLGLPEHEAREEAVQVEAALRWLGAHPGWLLILDNTDTREAVAAVENLLPRLQRGHALITSRVSEWSGGVKTRDLDVLDPDAAVAFLLETTADRRRVTASDAQDARALATEDLEGLALALEQAGAFIKHTRCSFGDYRRRWRAREEKVRAWHDARLMQHPRSVLVTWDASLEQLDGAARALMNLLCWLAPAPLPRALLESEAARATLARGVGWLQEAGEVLAGADPEEALAALAAFSLLRWDAGNEAVRLHRLVQEVTRERIPDERRAAWLGAALELVDTYLPDDPPPQDVRAWPRWEPLRPHVAAVVAAADAAGIEAPTARLMNEFGLFLQTKAVWAEAELLMRRALAIDEASLGPEHPDVARDLNNVALLLKATNRLAEAEPLMRRVVTILEKSLGREHPSVATALNNLAHLSNRPAEPLMRRALAIDEASLGSEHPDVATVLNNLAQLLHDTNRLAEAEPLMRRVVTILEKSLGREHPSVATALNNLARLLQATNRLAEAEPLSRRHLQILLRFTADTGHPHPNLDAAIQNYAGLLAQMGQGREDIQARLDALPRAYGLARGR